MQVKNDTFHGNYIYCQLLDFNPINLGEWGVIFAHDKFKFKSFLNGLWYELETLSLFLTFTRDYLLEINWKKEKKIQKNIKFSGGNIFLYRGYCQK